MHFSILLDMTDVKFWMAKSVDNPSLDIKVSLLIRDSNVAQSVRGVWWSIIRCLAIEIKNNWSVI